MVILLSVFYIGNNFKESNFKLTENITDTPGRNREIIKSIIDSNIHNDENPLLILRESPKEKIIKRLIDSKDPIVYIYNTHQKEEYKETTYNITPTVFTASHMLEDELKELGIYSLVEEKDIMKEIDKRKLTYDDTYLITRECVTNAEKNKNLKYFFDVHRDSLKRELSVATVKGKKYAKLMFLVGKRNKNYEKNLVYIKKMEEYLNKNYSGILRNTYYKNYVYNQDLNDRVFLIEVGGQDNTLEEVYNSIKALAEAIKYMDDSL